MQKMMNTYFFGLCAWLAMPCYAMQSGSENTPYWKLPISYNYKVTVKKVYEDGSLERYGIIRALLASETVEKAQLKIVRSIRDHTRDFKARKDGRLNADQEVWCELVCYLPEGKTLHSWDSFQVRAGDAWYKIEAFITLYAGIKRLE